MSRESGAHPQTIDQVTIQLSAWARDATHGVPVSLAPPEAAPSALEVSVYLLDVTRKPALRGPGQPPLQVWLRYLVSAWGPEPTAAHHALHQLVFAALSGPDLDVDEDPIPAALWTAIGTPPRPGFVLRCPLRVEPYERNLPLARQVDIRAIAPTVLHGRLVVPSAGLEGETLALSGARIEVVGTRTSTTSGRGGHFRLENVLRGKEGKIRLSVQAKGRAFVTEVSELGTAGAPITIEVPWPTARLEGRLEDRRGNPIPGARIELPDRRQYVTTREDGRFVLDGLPPDLDPAQLVALQAGERLAVSVGEDSVMTISRGGASSEPVVIQL